MHGEAGAVDDPLDGADLLLRRGAVGVHHGDGGGEVAERDMIAAERLKREVGIDHLVVGIGIEELDRLIVDHLAQQRGDRLAFVEPLPAQLRQRLRRLGLVERDEARHPAVGKSR